LPFWGVVDDGFFRHFLFFMGEEVRGLWAMSFGLWALGFGV
jgi:hypothetical protein